MDKVSSSDQLSNLISYGIYAIVAGIAIALVAYFMRALARARDLERTQEAEAEIFARTLLGGASAPAGAAGAGPAAAPAQSHKSSDMFPAAGAPTSLGRPSAPPVSPPGEAAMGDDSSGALGGMGAAGIDVSALAGGAVMPSPGAPGARPTPIADSVVARMKQANLVDSVDGPVRAKNPAIVGTVVMTRAKQRLAILESAIRQNDADMEFLMRQYDGVIMPGPGREPLYVKRLEYFISDQISL